MYSLLSSQRVSNSALIAVLLAQLVTLLPLFLFLPLWMPLLWMFSCAWRLQIIRGKWTMPPGLIKGSLAVACVGGLYLSFGFNVSVEPLVAFLLCGVILKVIEAQKVMDAVVIVFVCFVVLATQLLFSQSIGALLYAVVSFVFLLLSLNAIFGVSKLHFLKRLKKIGLFSLQAFPIACLLFFVMPRMPPLWSMPDTSSATTGFSDSMSPGGISSLIKSKKVAFRVTFFDAASSHLNNKNETSSPQLSAAEIDTLLPGSKRYWRGLVLDEYDGRTWKRSPSSDSWNFKPKVQDAQSTQKDFIVKGSHKNATVENAAGDASKSQPSLEPEYIHYGILLEPHNQKWLFNLMRPISIQRTNRAMSILSDGLIKSRFKVTSRLQYELISDITDYPDESISQHTRFRSTYLPAGQNRRARKLINDWKVSGLSDQEIIDKALALFNQSFAYTLNPPKLGDNAIDEFLFVTRKGFCEHFSSTFVYLMRLADIPSRVVVGYLGGEVNTVENYLLVKQSDAHAWAEVWLPHEGWIRIDPTSAVAPNRIQQSLSDALSDTDRGVIESSLFDFEFIDDIRQRMDAVSYLWNRYIVEFDNSSQDSLLTQLLGAKTPLRIALFLAVCGSLIIIVIFVLPNILVRKKLSDELRLLKKYEKKCRRINVVRDKNESPSQLSRKVGERYPHLKERADFIATLFDQILYAKNKIELTEKLERAIKKFEPSKRTIKSN